MTSDMAPQLSIIVTHFNHAQALPKLLDSILEQTFKNLEVIIADGCSDVPCDDVVESYKNKNLAIRLIKAQNRQYPLASKLAGFDISRGRAIFFADADDVLVSNDALMIHVNMLLDEDLDIVNFRSIFFEQSNKGELVKISPDVGLADTLSGRDIFKKYIRTPTSYPNLWSKVFSRRLWQRIAHIPVLNHPDFYGAEDRLMNTLAMFYAESYKRTDIIGYGYNYSTDKPLVWSVKSIPSYYTMLNELIPYLRDVGCAEDDIEILDKNLRIRLSYYVRIFVENSITEDNCPIPNEVVSQLLQYSSVETMIKGLIVGHPSWTLSSLNREEGNLRADIEALKKVRNK